MKKRLLAILIGLSCLLACVCAYWFSTTVAVNDKYMIRRQSGKHVMQFYTDIPEQDNTSKISGSVMFAEDPHFHSLSDMKNAILKGNVSDGVLEKFRTESSQRNTVELIDLDDLYEPSLPGNVTFNSVSWGGRSYTLWCASDEIEEALLWPCTQKQLEERYDLYTGFIEEETSYNTFILDETIADRNARCVRWSNAGGVYELLIYELSLENKRIVVLENHTLMDIHAPNSTSDGIPESICLFGYGDDICFVANLRGLTERPSVEWLSQFGLRKFEG